MMSLKGGLKGGEQRDTAGTAFKKAKPTRLCSIAGVRRKISVKMCIPENPNICVLLMENCKSSSTIQLAIASAAAATEQHRQQQQTTIALAATAGILRLLLPERIRKRLFPE
jgi:hypothetical protein